MKIKESREEYLKGRREYQRKYALKLRKLCLKTYGGDPPKCGCCGETEIKFLALDHINGGGTSHRKKIGKYGSSMNVWLKTNGFPKDYQVLCHNCNSAKGYYGQCPHKIIIKNI